MQHMVANKTLLLPNTGILERKGCCVVRPLFVLPGGQSVLAHGQRSMGVCTWRQGCFQTGISNSFRLTVAVRQHVTDMNRPVVHL